MPAFPMVFILTPTHLPRFTASRFPFRTSFRAHFDRSSRTRRASSWRRPVPYAHRTTNSAVNHPAPNHPAPRHPTPNPPASSTPNKSAPDSAVPAAGSPNFFLDTVLTRLPSSTYPNAIDQLLLAVSHHDRFIPLYDQRPLVTLQSSPASLSSTAVPLLWTPARLQSWLHRTRAATHASLAPLTLTLAHSPIHPPTTYFAVDISDSPTPPSPLPPPLRTSLSLCRSDTHAALLAHASALLSWHFSAPFCARCAHRTLVTQGGAARLCPNPACATRNIYPRVMPSVLALVLRAGGSEVLLGRKASWPPRRYSVLAGFAELFESLEQTVAREVREETGVVVDRDSIRYHSSQPWPSAPHASLMSGFRAYVSGAENARVEVDEVELESAQWFRKSWLKENIDEGNGGGDGISIPGPTSLARRMIMEWLEEPDS